LHKLPLKLFETSIFLLLILVRQSKPDEDSEAVAEILWQQAKASVKAQAVPVLKGVNYQAQVKHKESWATVSSEEDSF